jgi:predicted RNA-binding protein with PUA-like domain
MRPFYETARGEVPMGVRYWLFKSDPETFGWSDLAKSPGRRTAWDGVRNYQARNLLRDDIRSGDGVLFYHSGDVKAVVGTCAVTKSGFPDATQFDRKHKGFDPDAERADPRWYAVEITLGAAFSTPLTLDALRKVPALSKMMLLQRGNRLSVQPVTPEEWTAVLKLGGRSG